MTKLNRTPDFDVVSERLRKRARETDLYKRWRKLPIGQKANWVRPLMEVGHSNWTAGEVLGITEGKVAGVRNREEIPSRNAPGFAAINAEKE